MIKDIERFQRENSKLFAANNIKLLRMVDGPQEMPFWSYGLYEWKEWWILCFATLPDGWSLWVTKAKNEFVLPRSGNFINSPTFNWEIIYTYTEPRRLERVTELTDEMIEMMLQVPTETRKYNKYLGEHLKTFIQMVS